MPYLLLCSLLCRLCWFCVAYFALLLRFDCRLPRPPSTCFLLPPSTFLLSFLFSAALHLQYLTAYPFALTVRRSKDMDAALASVRDFTPPATTAPTLPSSALSGAHDSDANNGASAAVPQTSSSQPPSTQALSSTIGIEVFAAKTTASLELKPIADRNAEVSPPSVIGGHPDRSIATCLSPATASDDVAVTIGGGDAAVERPATAPSLTVNGAVLPVTLLPTRASGAAVAAHAASYSTMSAAAAAASTAASEAGPAAGRDAAQAEAALAKRVAEVMATVGRASGLGDGSISIGTHGARGMARRGISAGEGSRQRSLGAIFSLPQPPHAGAAAGDQSGQPLPERQAASNAVAPSVCAPVPAVRASPVDSSPSASVGAANGSTDAAASVHSLDDAPPFRAALVRQEPSTAANIDRSCANALPAAPRIDLHVAATVAVAPPASAAGSAAPAIAPARTEAATSPASAIGAAAAAAGGAAGAAHTSTGAAGRQRSTTGRVGRNRRALRAAARAEVAAARPHRHGAAASLAAVAPAESYLDHELGLATRIRTVNDSDGGSEFSGGSGHAAESIRSGVSGTSGRSSRSRRDERRRSRSGRAHGHRIRRSRSAADPPFAAAEFFTLGSRPTAASAASSEVLGPLPGDRSSTAAGDVSGGPGTHSGRSSAPSPARAARSQRSSRTTTSAGRRGSASESKLGGSEDFQLDDDDDDGRSSAGGWSSDSLSGSEDLQVRAGMSVRDSTTLATSSGKGELRRRRPATASSDDSASEAASGLPSHGNGHSHGREVGFVHKPQPQRFAHVLEPQAALNKAAHGSPSSSQRTDSAGESLRRAAGDMFSRDLIWLFLALLLITIAESNVLRDTPAPRYMSIFGIIFELCSAYGTVGLSLGFPGTVTSLSAQFGTFSKLVIVAVMLAGRHRGLPVAIDPAVYLPALLASTATADAGSPGADGTAGRGISSSDDSGTDTSSVHEESEEEPSGSGSPHASSRFAVSEQVAAAAAVAAERDAPAVPSA